MLDRSPCAEGQQLSSAVLELDSGKRCEISIFLPYPYVTSVTTSVYGNINSTANSIKRQSTAVNPRSAAVNAINMTIYITIKLGLW